MIFGAPWVLLALVALPVLWWLLRVTPPAPRTQDFPAIRLLLGLRAREETAARTPWWLLLLRTVAAGLLIVGLAGPVLDAAGLPVRLHAETSPKAPLVDGACRIMDADGAPIPGLFGIGLAAGFVPRGALGGEPSFSGQANGLWLWQNDVGALIVDAVTSQPGRAGDVALTGQREEVLA